MNSISKDNGYELDDEIYELLDLYVARALDDEEVQKAEQIMLDSLEARNYVDDARSMFASFQDNEDPSQFLLSSIKSQIALESKNSNIAPVTNINSKRNYLVPFITGAVAASFIAVMLSVALWPQSSNSNKDNFALDKQMGAFTSSSGTTTVSLKGGEGQQGLNIYMHEDGDMMIDYRNLDSLDRDSTYQLWAIVETATGQKVISAGVLGSKPGVAMSRVSGTVVAFALTQEVSGGVDKSEKEALYSASVA